MLPIDIWCCLLILCDDSWRSIGTAGSAARVFAALTCGHEHVAAEAGRLLTRLWAPRAGRRGAFTWTLTKGPRSQEEDGGQLSSVEDPIISKQAKSTCLGPAGRSAALLIPRSFSSFFLPPSPSCFFFLFLYHSPFLFILVLFLSLLVVSRPVLLMGALRGDRPAGPLAVMALVEAIAAVVCEPGVYTTDPIILSAMLQASCPAVDLLSLISVLMLFHAVPSCLLDACKACAGS